MRLFSQDVSAAGVSPEDAVALLAPPFDLAFQPAAHYRGVLVDVWRPGLVDGLVWSSIQFAGRPSIRMGRQIIRGHVVEDSSASILAFLRLLNGRPVTRADIASISFRVFDTLSDSAVPGFDWIEIDPGSVLFDELQTADLDARWNRAGGANFIHDLPPTAWPEGGRRYRYQAQFVEALGAQWFLLADLCCDTLLSS